MLLTRRESLGLAVGLSATGQAWAVPPATKNEPSLHSLAMQKGRRFGTAVGAGRPGTRTGSFADERYRKLMIAECGLIVPENELKWGAVRPDPKSFDFAQADRLFAFAETHGMEIRGHTLLWHHPAWFPGWVESYDFGVTPASAAERMLREHISTVCNRYGKRIGSYDVINEAVDADTGAMRETAFTRHLTPDYVIELAFRTAREAAPHAQLVYNDYMSWEPGNEKHRDGVLRLLERMKARNVPIDALGVQAHIGTANTDTSTGFGARQEAEWRRFLDAVVAMGYELVITEFDVHDKGLPADIYVRDRAVADYARAYLDLMLSYPQLGDVLVWGLSDRYSWLQNLWLRPDRLPKRPTPYDAEFRPKLLRSAIADALRNAAPRRRAKAES